MVGVKVLTKNVDFVSVWFEFGGGCVVNFIVSCVSCCSKWEF